MRTTTVKCGRKAPDRKHGVPVGRLLAWIDDALFEMREYLKAIGPCSHDANLCVCDLKRKIEQGDELRKTLKGEA